MVNVQARSQKWGHLEPPRAALTQEQADLQFLHLEGLPFIYEECMCWGWRDDQEVKSIDCSCRGPGFGYQYPHDGSQSRKC